MRIGGVDFPEPLLNALRDGRLVVFAGVSMGPHPTRTQPRTDTRQWTPDQRQLVLPVLSPHQMMLPKF